ncbi:MucBP domain-containing protein, partial [Secundilactobacillus silagei]
MINPYIPQTTTITYTYDAAHVHVNVKYVDEKGNTIKPDDTVNGSFNSATTIPQPEISGYTYDTGFTKTDTDNASSFTVTNLTNVNTVTLHYKANSETVTVKHVDENNVAIGTDSTIQTKFNTTLDLSTADKNYKVDGYEVAPDAQISYKVATDSPQTVTIKYIKDIKATVTVPSNQGDQTVPDVTGKTGEHVTVDVPPLEGYTPDKTTVPATVNADGTITVDNPTTTGKVTYTPNDAKANVTIPSNQGDQTVPDVTGKTGEHVDVTVPVKPGYTADKPTVPATVNADGTITVDNPTTTGKVTYTPNDAKANVTIPSNQGDQTVPNVTGKTGEHVDVTVPVKPGYTADKSTVPATVNADGTITVDNPTTTGKVTYTPNDAKA